MPRFLLNLLDYLGKSPSRLQLKPFLKRWDLAIAGIYFHTFNTMHGKEHDIGGNLLSGSDLPGKVIDGIQVDSTQARARRSERQYHSPEFLSRHVQRDNHHTARGKWFGHDLGNCGRFIATNSLLLQNNREIYREFFWRHPPNVDFCPKIAILVRKQGISSE